MVIQESQNWLIITLVKTLADNCSMKVLVTMVRLSIAPDFRISKLASFR